MVTRKSFRSLALFRQLTLEISRWVLLVQCEQTRALMQADTIQQLRDKVSELQLGQSQCAQNAYLVNTLRPYPVPAYNPCGCQCGGNFGGAFAMA